jgi:uncharacterized protein YjbJ (UPF0337 family)
MEFNKNIIQGKWKEMKGEIQKAWGKLTDDELEKTKGDVKAIEGLVQQKYGHAQNAYSDKLSGIVKKFETKKDDVVDATKDGLRK